MRGGLGERDRRVPLCVVHTCVCAAMRGAERGGLWSRSESQRRGERRTRVILQGAMKRLDQARALHINTLIREQRGIHTDLINIHTGLCVCVWYVPVCACVLAHVSVSVCVCVRR